MRPEVCFLFIPKRALLICSRQVSFQGTRGDRFWAIWWRRQSQHSAQGHPGSLEARSITGCVARGESQPQGTSNRRDRRRQNAGEDDTGLSMLRRVPRAQQRLECALLYKHLLASEPTVQSATGAVTASAEDEIWDGREKDRDRARKPSRWKTVLWGLP